MGSTIANSFQRATSRTISRGMERGMGAMRNTVLGRGGGSRRFGMGGGGEQWGEGRGLGSDAVPTAALTGQGTKADAKAVERAAMREHRAATTGREPLASVVGARLRSLGGQTRDAIGNGALAAGRYVSTDSAGRAELRSAAAERLRAAGRDLSSTARYVAQNPGAAAKHAAVGAKNALAPVAAKAGAVAGKTALGVAIAGAGVVALGPAAVIALPVAARAVLAQKRQARRTERAAITADYVARQREGTGEPVAATGESQGGPQDMPQSEQKKGYDD